MSSSPVRAAPTPTWARRQRWRDSSSASAWATPRTVRSAAARGPANRPPARARSICDERPGRRGSGAMSLPISRVSRDSPATLSPKARRLVSLISMSGTASRCGATVRARTAADTASMAAPSAGSTLSARGEACGPTVTARPSATVAGTSRTRRAGGREERPTWVCATAVTAVTAVPTPSRPQVSRPAAPPPSSTTTSTPPARPMVPETSTARTSTRVSSRRRPPGRGNHQATCSGRRNTGPRRLSAPTAAAPQARSRAVASHWLLSGSGRPRSRPGRPCTPPPPVPMSSW